MEMKCPKRVVSLFLNLNRIGPCSGLSNNELCILVAQWTAKLPEVKFGGIKKHRGLEPGPYVRGVDRAKQQNIL